MKIKSKAVRLQSTVLAHAALGLAASAHAQADPACIELTQPPQRVEPGIASSSTEAAKAHEYDGFSGKGPRAIGSVDLRGSQHTLQPHAEPAAAGRAMAAAQRRPDQGCQDHQRGGAHPGGAGTRPDRSAICRRPAGHGFGGRQLCGLIVRRWPLRGAGAPLASRPACSRAALIRRGSSTRCGAAARAGCLRCGRRPRSA